MFFAELIPLLGHVAPVFFKVLSEQLSRNDKPDVLEVTGALLAPIMDSGLGHEAKRRLQREIMPVATIVFESLEFGGEA